MNRLFENIALVSSSLLANAHFAALRFKWLRISVVIILGIKVKLYFCGKMVDEIG
jgi:hypothetical protein